MTSSATRRLLRLTHPRPGLVLLGVLSALLAVAALVLQSWLRLNPCPLCIFQRLLFMLFSLVALLGAALPGGERLRRTFGAGLALIALGGLGVAVYQSLMQALPDLVPECSYTDPGPIEQFVNWLGMHALDNAILSELFLATGLCSSQEWSFLGLSMANWSAVSFLSFAAFSLWLAFGRRTTRPAASRRAAP